MKVNHKITHEVARDAAAYLPGRFCLAREVARE